MTEKERKIKKVKLINNVEITCSDGSVIRILSQRYYVRVYCAVYAGDSRMPLQVTFSSVEAANQKHRQTIAWAKKRKEKVEFSEIEVPPCGEHDEEMDKMSIVKHVAVKQE